MLPDDPARTEAETRPRSSRRRTRTAQDVRARRRQILTWSLSIGLCMLLVNAIVGENGYLATLRAEHDRALAWASVVRVRLENRQLQQAGRRLQSDPAAVEEAARRELGMIKPGETLVIVKDAHPPAPAPVK